MILYSNAKINLGLNITEKRSDGYHNLETIFLPIDCKDIIEILPQLSQSNTKISFSSSGIEIPGNTNNNLCIKAYSILTEAGFELPPIKLHLHKQVPMGAGLGGGSANGSCVLNYLNNHYNLSLNEEELINFALKLGSDCPFFILNKPCYAKGRGEVLQKIKLDLLQNYKLVIVNPQIHISTAWAFNNINPKLPKNNLIDLINLPINQWQVSITNDFEKPVFEEFPSIASIKEILIKNNAIYASLTGTGSTVFGIIPKNQNFLGYKNLFPENYYVDVVNFLL